MSDNETHEFIHSPGDVEHQGVVQDPTLVAVARMSVRYAQMGKGHLKIYTRTVNNVQVMEAFTLMSLADCMGLPPGTIEGRYHRGRLFNWKMDIPTGESRPVRGFPLALLQDVMTILSTRGARVEAGSNDERVVRPGVGSGARFPLRYEVHAGKRYITIPALADHYGVSTTTIRNKLSKSHLLQRAVNLSSPVQGGRPRRGFREDQYEQLVNSIENGAQYMSEVQTVFNDVFTSQVRAAMIHPSGQPMQLPAGNPGSNVIQFPGMSDNVHDTFAQIEGLLKQAKPAPVAPGPVTTVSLSAWVDKLREAPEIWLRDAVVDAMVKAGLDNAQISEAIALADSAPADTERSGGELA